MQYVDTENVEMVLLGNKVDDEDKREVSESDGRTVAEEYGIPFFETSALKKINIEEVWRILPRFQAFPAKRSLYAGEFCACGQLPCA